MRDKNFWGWPKILLTGSVCACIYVYLHTPGQKYKTTLKNEEKDIVYNF